MIRAYFGGEPKPAERGRIVIYKAMCDLLWTLWGLIQLANEQPGRRFPGLCRWPLRALQGMMETGDFGAPCGGRRQGVGWSARSGFARSPDGPS